MSVIRFTIPGKPTAKARPRFRVVKPKAAPEFVNTYTTASTRDYERTVAWACKAAMQGRARINGALALSINVWLPIPKSWPKRDQAAARAGQLHATSKPDADNYAKSITDGMSGIAFDDDAQIVSLSITKAYADQPRAEVELRAFAPPPSTATLDLDDGLTTAAIVRA